MNSHSRSILAACALISHQAAAQNVLREHRGAPPLTALGLSALRHVDLDGDGVEEYVLGDSRGLRVFRGADGAPLFDALDARGPLGDVDGDGAPDFWGADGRDLSNGWFSTTVYSGSNGDVLARYAWPQGFTPDGPTLRQPMALDDVDGDGRAEFLRVDSSWVGRRAVIGSGRDGAILRVHELGTSCVALNDIDGDGARDYFLGVWPGLSGSSPTPRVISSVSGAVLVSVSLPQLDGEFAAVGDVDGDGAFDLVFRAPSGPGVVVVSSLTGAVLRSFPEQLVESSRGVAARGDFDGDGVDDLVLRDGATLELLVRSLATGAVLQNAELLASGVTGIGDLDGDGRDELLVGAAHALSGAGKALILTGAHSERVGLAFGFGDGSSGPCPCGTSPTPGEGCLNSSQRGARLAAWGSSSVLARDLLIHEHGQLLDSGQLGDSFLIFGASAAPTPVALGAGLLALGGPLRRIGRSSSGAWDLPSLAPWGSFAPAQTIYLQAWYRELSPHHACGYSGNLTNALAIAFTP